MMTPMSLMIDNLMSLLARRVVFLMLLLVRRVVFLMMLMARRWSIVFLLSMDLTFLSRLRRSLSMHTCVVNPFLSFVAKWFLM